MLSPQVRKNLSSGPCPASLYILKPTTDTFRSLSEILAFPLEIVRKSFVERCFSVLPTAFGVLF
jgi:hypothetical protein